MIATAVLLWVWMGAAQERVAGSPAQMPATSEESFRISGTLVDAMDGKPLAGAQVMISGPDAQTTLTREDGGFAFENLEAGKYALSAHRKGYPQAFYKQHEQFSTAIIAGPGLNTQNLRFALRPGASISGQVTDDGGDAVREARVMLFRRDILGGRRSTFEQNETTTNDLGRYRFGGLEAGTYFVAVSGKPWYAQRGVYTTFFGASGVSQQVQFAPGEPELDVVYPVTFFFNATELASASPIAVRSGDAQMMDVRLQAAPALRLTVRTSGAEGENVFARVSQPIGENSRVDLNFQVSSQQIEPGLVEIGGLTTGRFNLVVTSTKDGQSSEHSESLVLTGNSEIRVDGGTSQVDVSGSAKLEDGSAVQAGLMFQLRSKENGAIYNMRTEGNGGFALKDQKVPPGRYEVWFLRQQQEPMGVKSVRATNAKVSGRTVDIGSSGDVKLEVVLWQGVGDVSGFTMRDGKPIDGVMVMLVPEVPETNLVLFRHDQSDSDGSFAIGGVQAGKYTVVAIENGWDMEWSTPEVLKRYLTGGEKVEITPEGKIEVKVKVQ
jgi:hypothetical protein